MGAYFKKYCIDDPTVLARDVCHGVHGTKTEMNVAVDADHLISVMTPLVATGRRDRNASPAKVSEWPQSAP